MLTYLAQMGILRKLAIAVIVFLVVSGGLIFYLSRGDTADLSVDAVAGVDPTLQAPKAESFPTVEIAKPVGWAEGEAPVPAEDLEVARFAEGLDHPRVLYALPNGDVLVTLTRAPGDQFGGEGGFFDTIKGWIAEYLLGEAGATGESPNQIVLLRDADGDGVADQFR